jgi:hypothetical protein
LAGTLNCPRAFAAADATGCRQLPPSRATVAQKRHAPRHSDQHSDEIIWAVADLWVSDGVPQRNGDFRPVHSLTSRLLTPQRCGGGPSIAGRHLTMWHTSAGSLQWRPAVSHGAGRRHPQGDVNFARDRERGHAYAWTIRRLGPYM